MKKYFNLLKISIALLILLGSISFLETNTETSEVEKQAEQMHQEHHDEGAMMADDMPMEEQSMED